MVTEESLLAQEQKRGAIRAPETPALAVRVRGLFKRYKDGTEANRDIDLDVRRGLRFQ